jgi:hypothetical protein
MALVGNTLPTLLDQIKRTDPNGSIAKVVEALTKKNPVLQDAVFKMGNLETGERVTTRTGLPGVAWRRLNEGVAASKSQTDQYDESCGMLSGMSVVDVEVAKLNGNEAAFRASEDMAFLQAFNNEVSTGIFYHTTKTAPEKFNGLTPRLDALSGTWSQQVFDALNGAANATLTSIWLVCWGENTVYGIYPKGSNGGLSPKDMGEQIWDDGSGTGKKFIAYVTQWMWKIGLVVKDARYICRIANINSAALVKDAATGSDLLLNMIKAYHQINDINEGRAAWYCNRTIGTWLHIQAMNAVKNSTLSLEMVAGKPVTFVLGIPVRETDALTNAENRVV